MKYKSICRFIIVSENFSTKFIDTTYGNALKTYFDELDVTNTTKGAIISDILDYLDYLYNELNINNSNYNTYVIELSKLKKKYPAQQNARNLPTSKDIVLFIHILNQFYDTCENVNLKLLYMPVLIWWKLTTIIPMRPAEITTKLTRECIDKEDNKFYLKIRRVKQKSSKRKGALPILPRLEINLEMVNLIEEYKKLTEEYGETQTLFSYRAHKALTTILARKDLILTCHRDNKVTKYNEDYFSPIIFYSLLDSFYSVIIQKEFRITSPIKHIAPGDTRHFAFFSLLLQGLSEIEIALLGGHTTLEAQQHYQQGIKYYIDSQLYELLYKKMGSMNFMPQKTFQTIYEIWSNMIPKNDLEIMNYRKLKIGWCTSQFKDPSDYCEDLECCYFCSKFWIEKTEVSLEEMKKDMINNYMRTINERLNFDLDFLQTYIETSSLVQICGDNFFDRRKWTQIRTTASKVKSDCEQVAKIKYSLLDIHLIDKHLHGLSDALIELDRLLDCE